MGDRGHNRHGLKKGGCCAPLPLSQGGAVLPSSTMWPGPIPTSMPSGILIHIVIWQQQTWAENWGAPPPFGGGVLGAHLTECHLGRGLTLYQVASWSIKPFGHNRYRLKIWGSAPFWSPSNIMWPGPRPTCTPSFILIHPTVCPQYTNVSDTTEQDRQTDNGLIA